MGCGPTSGTICHPFSRISLAAVVEGRRSCSESSPTGRAFNQCDKQTFSTSSSSGEYSRTNLELSLPTLLALVSTVPRQGPPSHDERDDHVESTEPELLTKLIRLDHRPVGDRVLRNPSRPSIPMRSPSAIRRVVGEAYRTNTDEREQFISERRVGIPPWACSRLLYGGPRDFTPSASLLAGPREARPGEIGQRLDVKAHRPRRTGKSAQRVARVGPDRETAPPVVEGDIVEGGSKCGAGRSRRKR